MHGWNVYYIVYVEKITYILIHFSRKHSSKPYVLCKLHSVPQTTCSVICLWLPDVLSLAAEFSSFCWFSASSWLECYIIRFVWMCCIRLYILSFVFTLLFGVLWTKILTNFAMDTPMTVIHGASVTCTTSRRVHGIVYSRDLLLSLRSMSSTVLPCNRFFSNGCRPPVTAGVSW